MSDVSDGIRPVDGQIFRLGRALSRSFALFTRGFAKFALIAAAMLVPMLLLQIILGDPAPQLKPKGAPPDYRNLAIALVSTPLFIIAHAACVSGAIQEMQEERVGVRSSLIAALRRFFPIFGVDVVFGLTVVIGLVALVAPAFIAISMFYVAVPACLVERLGVLSSLGRSRRLTKGRRWPIFGLLLLMIVASLAVGFFFVFLRLKGAPALPTLLAHFAWNAAYLSFSGVLAAVVYHDLRIDKEGVAIEKLTSVFD
jgi:hypothetical protein